MPTLTEEMGDMEEIAFLSEAVMEVMVLGEEEKEGLAGPDLKEKERMETMETRDNLD